jgi:hypothetical protein
MYESCVVNIVNTPMRHVAPVLDVLSYSYQKKTRKINSLHHHRLLLE